MKKHRQLEWAAVAVGIAAAVAAWSFDRHAESERAEIATFTVQIAEAQKRDQTLLAGKPETPIPAPAGASSAASASASASAAQPKETWLSRLQNDPKFQNIYFARERSLTAIRYAPFLSALKLSADEIGQFKENVLWKTAGQMDLQDTLRAQGLSIDDPAAVSISKQLASVYEAAQTSLLGAQGYQQLSSFEQNLTSQSLVSNLAGAAAIAGTPLDSTQVRQLIPILAQAQQSQVGGGSTDWESITKQARAILSPAQLDVFNSGELNGNGWGWQFQERLNSLIYKAGKADAAAGPAGN